MRDFRNINNHQFSRRKLNLGLCIVALLTFLLPQWVEAKTTLHILSTTDTSAFQNLTKKFEALNQDIKIDYQERTTKTVYRKVMSAPRNRKANIDLVISSAMDLQVQLVNNGLALPYTSEATDLTPDWARWRNELYGFTYEPIVLAYNKAAFHNYPLPKSHADLAQLLTKNAFAFGGKIGTYDINRAGAGYLFITQDFIQSKETFRLIEAFGQTAIQTYCCTSNILDRVISGELTLGYNVIGSYALKRAQHDKNLGILLFSDYTIVMARTAFIYKYTQNRDAAERFLEFLLSKQGQSEILKSSALIPISPDLRMNKLPNKGSHAYLPIKLGVGLLTYQDELKRKYFIRNWNKILSRNLD